MEECQVFQRGTFIAEKFEIERVVDSMATISEILFERFKCMECNQCEPCGPVFMEALNVLRKSGNVNPAARGQGRAQ
jgi:hypothetical protein